MAKAFGLCTGARAQGFGSKAIAILVFVAVPRIADAHLVTTGLGPLYDGISHLFLSPDDLLGVLAIALLAGLGGARFGRAALFVLPVAWFAGGLFGLRASAEVSMPVLNSLSFLVVGVLVALDRRLPERTVIGLTVVLGLLHGFLNGTAVGQASGGGLALVGISTTVFVLIALVAAIVVSLRTDWARVVVRVAGSWIAAIGLLMIGWSVRGG